MILAIVLSWNVAQWWRETNSYAASVRGSKQYVARKFDQAAAQFSRAAAIAPTPLRQFNLGTAQIAAGHHEQGAATLEKSMAEPRLRPDALFNRGNGALEAKAWDYAIRDYTDALRVRPQDAATKRNLEIALRRKAEQRKQQQSGNNGQQGSGSKPQPQPQAGAPQAPAQNQPKGDPNAEALLRSVQQQEQEELSRMHKPQPERVHIGW